MQSHSERFRRLPGNIAVCRRFWISFCTFLLNRPFNDLASLLLGRFADLPGNACGNDERFPALPKNFRSSLSAAIAAWNSVLYYAKS